MSRRPISLYALLLLAIMPSWLQAADKITLHALFKNKAIIMIDGARRVLSVGQTSPEGLKLLDTDTREETARIEMNGRIDELRLGVVISAITPQGSGGATLYADPSGHFYADGSINGVPVRFLVDTGATSIAMNSAVARRIGVDYMKRGRPGIASTASGMVRTYQVKLKRVKVGDIVLHNVEAGVLEGGFPHDVLLGMSFLGRLNMKREGNRMELRKRY